MKGGGDTESYAPTDKGRETLCVGGWVGGRCEGCLHGGSLRDVCGSVVCGNVVYVGVRGGCVNGEGIGLENMFHY